MTRSRRMLSRRSFIGPIDFIRALTEIDKCQGRCSPEVICRSCGGFPANEKEEQYNTMFNMYRTIRI